MTINSGIYPYRLAYEKSENPYYHDILNNREAVIDLLDSTIDLHHRFGFPFWEKLNANLDGSRLAILESLARIESEMAEVKDALFKGQVAYDEFADVIVTVLSLVYLFPGDNQSLYKAIYDVIHKNDSKTHQTHQLSNGKIQKKSK